MVPARNARWKELQEEGNGQYASAREFAQSQQWKTESAALAKELRRGQSKRAKAVGGAQFLFTKECKVACAKDTTFADVGEFAKSDKWEAQRKKLAKAKSEAVTAAGGKEFLFKTECSAAWNKLVAANDTTFANFDAFAKSEKWEAQRKKLAKAKREAMTAVGGLPFMFMTECTAAWKKLEAANDTTFAEFAKSENWGAQRNKLARDKREKPLALRAERLNGRNKRHREHDLALLASGIFASGSPLGPKKSKKLDGCTNAMLAVFAS
jgi:hypothetical protein